MSHVCSAFWFLGHGILKRARELGPLASDYKYLHGKRAVRNHHKIFVMIMQQRGANFSLCTTAVFKVTLSWKTSSTTESPLLASHSNSLPQRSHDTNRPQKLL